jgi:hypothetical protein
MQLEKLKIRLGNPDVDDELLYILLEDAQDIICDIRNSDKVEPKYLGTQIRIAVELFNKMGAEGEVSHDENGMKRTYERGGISASLLRQITPVIRTLNNEVRVIE